MAAPCPHRGGFYRSPATGADLPKPPACAYRWHMSEPATRKVSPKNVLIDAVLTGAAFVLFFRLAEPHVPSEDPFQIKLWSGYCAACMTGVFWLAWQMLKAVYRHQREAARARQ